MPPLSSFRFFAIFAHMYHRLLPLLLLALPLPANASGKEAFAALKRCVMENEARLCHTVLTEPSQALFDRFRSYGLMPCLPTNFSYSGEAKNGAWTVVKATMPAPDNKMHRLKLAFAGDAGVMKLDVPESLRMGLGERWQEKIQMAERIYLALGGGPGAHINCEQAGGLIGQ